MLTIKMLIAYIAPQLRDSVVSGTNKHLIVSMYWELDNLLDEDKGFNAF